MEKTNNRASEDLQIISEQNANELLVSSQENDLQLGNVVLFKIYFAYFTFQINYTEAQTDFSLGRRGLFEK